MKKLVLLILLPFFTASFAYAQMEEPDESFIPASTVGVQGGLNFSKIDSDLGANTVRRKAIHANIFYEKFLSPKFSIQPEIQYSSEGWIKEAATGDIEAKLQSVNLTTMGKFHIAGGFNLQAGVQTALIMDASENNAATTLALDERLKRFNLSAVFGVGYDFGFGLRLGGRYYQGLININDGYNTGSTTVNNEIKTTTFQLFIGFGFALPGNDRGYAGN